MGNEELDLRAVDGRVPGRRGLATRQRLLEHTLTLIQTTSYRDLKVVDIARESGTSPATFYQYFADAESAVLALSEDLVDEGGTRLIAPLDEAVWHGQSSLDGCLAIADAFLDFWAENSALIAVIDLAALEGDQRFRDCRNRLLGAFTRAAAGVIERQRKAGFAVQDLDPEATAVVLVSMLSHVAAHQRGITESGVGRDGLRHSMARLIYAGVIGRTPLD